MGSSLPLAVLALVLAVVKLAACIGAPLFAVPAVTFLWRVFVPGNHQKSRQKKRP